MVAAGLAIARLVVVCAVARTGIAPTFRSAAIAAATAATSTILTAFTGFSSLLRGLCAIVSLFVARIRARIGTAIVTALRLSTARLGRAATVTTGDDDDDDDMVTDRPADLRVW